MSMAFENEIKKYEELRQRYQSLIINKMDREEYIMYNEVLFSTHSCAIEGNSFSVDDTRELKEKGLNVNTEATTVAEARESLLEVLLGREPNHRGSNLEEENLC